LKSSIFFKGNILLITGKEFPWLYPFCSGSEYLSYSQSFTIDVLMKGHDGAKRIQAASCTTARQASSFFS